MNTRTDIRSEHIANRELNLTLSGNNTSNGLGEYCAMNKRRANAKSPKLAQWFVFTPLMEQF